MAILGVQHEDFLETLVGLQRLLANHQCRMGFADRQPDLHEEPGGDQPVGVGELGAESEGAGVHIHPVIGEIHRALVGVNRVSLAVFLIGKGDQQRHFLLRLGLQLAFLEQAANAAAWLAHGRQNRHRADPG